MNIRAVVVGICLVSSITVSSPITAVPSPSGVIQACDQEVFHGIDSRLEPDVVGRISYTNQPAVGFELLKGIPVVALRDELLGVTQKNLTRITVPDALKGIAVDKESRLIIQTDRGIQTIGNSGFVNQPALIDVVRGRLYDSGNQVLLEVRGQENEVQFIARAQGGRSFLIGTFEGQFHAASWNAFGLTAVVGNSLYAWNAGSQKIVRLITDRGLSAATDTVLVGPDRAVVTLKSTVILVTPQTVLILAGLQSARCRFEAGVLYLLDGHTGVVWSLKGLDQLGTTDGDRKHALELLKRVGKNTDQNSPDFLEAARIIGCREALRAVSSGGIPQH